MKVKRLIEMLQRQDPEADVETEGCDCIGTPNAVITLEEYFSKGKNASQYVGSKDVMITRE